MGGYSIRDAKTRKVLAHADAVLLKNVRFHVSESGRQRVLIEKRKNVHTWVDGEVVFDSFYPMKAFSCRVSYTPYVDKFFKTP